MHAPLPLPTSLRQTCTLVCILIIASSAKTVIGSFLSVAYWDCISVVAYYENTIPGQGRFF